MGRVERSRAHREPKSLRDFALSLAFSLSCVCVCGGSRAPLLFFRLVLVAAFAMCSMLAALAGLLIAGYSSKAFQAMGDPYLLPSIAAVVIGGTNILGGSGKLSGTVMGTILIVLLQSVLSVMQMPEAGRQIIYGIVIIAMLLAYGRGSRLRL